MNKAASAPDITLEHAFAI
ncbi:hypothetical protein RSAG8_09182, partial [Rhizoctonia solani AG-8 WAC10335]